jgi:hypothetical protein
MTQYIMQTMEQYPQKKMPARMRAFSYCCVSISRILYRDHSPQCNRDDSHLSVFAVTRTDQAALPASYIVRDAALHRGKDFAVSPHGFCYSRIP